MNPEDEATLVDPGGPEGGGDLRPGDRIAQYRVLELIGAGGMGRVYRVRDEQLDRVLALKVMGSGMAATPGERARFQREARAAAKLRHPGIVTIHGFGFDRGFAYFTMDLVEGPTLAERLEGGPLPEDEAVRLLTAVARAIQYAHDHGVLHRDLKPSNILLADGDSPRLADFGLAIAEGDEGSTRLTRSGAILGTPAYMSPEQARGDLARIDARSDIYGLGVIFYEMLSGTVPFGGDSPMAVVQRLLNEDPPPPSRHRTGIDREAEAICLKAMARRPEDRYASAAELAEDLWRHAQGVETMARPLTLAGKLARDFRRRRPLYATALVLLAVNAFYIAWLHSALSDLSARNRELEIRDRQRSAVELAQKASREGDPLVARERFAEALSLAPEPFEVLRLEAQYHQRHGRFDEAIPAYEEALAEARARGLDEETIALVLFDLYWCHAERDGSFPLQDTEAMREILDQLSALDPDDPWVLFARSRLEKDTAVAIRLLDRAIASSDVPFWQARGARGQYLAEAGKPDDALADFDEAIRIAPEEPILRGFRGWLHLYATRAAQAHEDFEQALRSSRPGERSYLLLGRGLAATLLGRHDSAEEDLLEAARDPATVRGLIGYGLRFKGVGETANLALSFQIQREPKRAHLRALHGIFLLSGAVRLEAEARERGLADAEAELEKAIELSPRYGEVLEPYLQQIRRARRR